MNAKPSGKRTCLYNAVQLEAVIESMATQAAGLLLGRQRVMIVGILRRGVPLADMLYQKLFKNTNLQNISRMNLQIKR